MKSLKIAPGLNKVVDWRDELIHRSSKSRHD